MATATLTSKGQITIPKEIREALRLRPGDKVRFHRRQDGSVVLEPRSVDLLSLKGYFKPKVRGVTIERMNEAIRRAGTRL